MSPLPRSRCTCVREGRGGGRSGADGLDVDLGMVVSQGREDFRGASQGGCSLMGGRCRGMAQAGDNGAAAARGSTNKMPNHE